MRNPFPSFEHLRFVLENKRITVFTRPHAANTVESAHVADIMDTFIAMTLVMNHHAMICHAGSDLPCGGHFGMYRAVLLAPSHGRIRKQLHAKRISCMTISSFCADATCSKSRYSYFAYVKINLCHNCVAFSCLYFGWLWESFHVLNVFEYHCHNMESESNPPRAAFLLRLLSEARHVSVYVFFFA